MKEKIRKAILDTGAVAVGFAAAGQVDESIRRQFNAWIASGKNAGMNWMQTHRSLRESPDNILEGTKSVISIAYPYGVQANEPVAQGISHYARGRDYHYTIRERLMPLTSHFTPGKMRICIDSAPLPERYWAVKAGIGTIGENGALIVPGIGPEVFLAEILTTLEFEPDSTLTNDSCSHCDKCVAACPTGALANIGLIDCRKCISYLTIEHKGEWNDFEAANAMRSDEGKQTLFGCDRCISICPLVSPPENSIIHTDENQQKKFSPFARTGSQGIIRNLRLKHLLSLIELLAEYYRY